MSFLLSSYTLALKSHHFIHYHYSVGGTPRLVILHAPTRFYDPLWLDGRGYWGPASAIVNNTPLL